MKGDQQPADLLDLPFDQYQRYRIAGEVLGLLAAQGVLPAPDAGTPITILDVGGYPGLLPRFVPPIGARTVVLDVVPDSSSPQRYGYTYLVGSGMALPFADGSFDCVASLDTLEHIPAEARPLFLSEMRRVARHAALVICPVFREETRLAEETLFEYIQWLLKARQEQLDEHISYGLPDFPAARAGFAEAGWATLDFPAGNLYTWLLMMVAKHYLISMQDGGADEVERKLDRLFNLTLSETDRQEPAYRQVLVATAAPQPAALAAIAERYPPVQAAAGDNMERMGLVQLLLRLLDLRIANHEDARLREQLEHRTRHAEGLASQVAEGQAAQAAVPILQADVAQLNAEIARLRLLGAEGEAERNRLHLEIAQRDAQVSTLAVQLQAAAAAQTAVPQLQADVAQLNAEIGRLRLANAEGMGEHTRLHLEIARRDTQVTALEVDRDRLAQEAARLGSTLAHELTAAGERHTFIARLHADLEQKNGHILYLEGLLRKIEAGRVLRLTRSINRLVGR